MAISLDAATSSADATATPLTWSHTVGAGSNQLLAVGVNIRTGTAQGSISGVTYNGVSMTKARADQSAAGTSFLETSVWLLNAPATGANTVSVSWTVGTTTANHVEGTSVSYKGASQTSVADASNGAVLNGSTVGDQTFTVTTVANNSWIFAVCGIASSAVPTITADQTARGSTVSGTTGATSNSMQAEDTNAAQTPAGAKTVGFTLGAGTSGTSRGFTMTGASFAPAASTSPVGKLFGTESFPVQSTLQSINRASRY